MQPSLVALGVHRNRSMNISTTVLAASEMDAVGESECRLGYFIYSFP